MKTGFLRFLNTTDLDECRNLFINAHKVGKFKVNWDSLSIEVTKFNIYEAIGICIKYIPLFFMNYQNDENLLFKEVGFYKIDKEYKFNDAVLYGFFNDDGIFCDYAIYRI